MTPSRSIPSRSQNPDGGRTERPHIAGAAPYRAGSAPSGVLTTTYRHSSAIRATPPSRPHAARIAIDTFSRDAGLETVHVAEGIRAASPSRSGPRLAEHLNTGAGLT